MASISFCGRSCKWNSVEDIKDVIFKIDACSEVVELDLSGNTICLEAAESVANSLKKKSSLKRLYLNDLFTGRGIDVIKPALISIFSALIEANADLAEINLSDNALSVKGIEALETILLSPCSYNLKVIKLNNLGIGIYGASNLAAIINSWVDYTNDSNIKIKLETLELGRNRLEDKGVEVLSDALKRITSLESLELYQNGIKCKGTQALAEILQNNQKLKNLNLNDNLIVEDGAIALSKCLSKMNQLTTLNVGDCLIRNLGAISIIDSLKSCKLLKHLDVGFNEITLDKGMYILETILTHFNLDHLILDGNLFGEEGCEKIIKLYDGKKSQTHLILSLEDDEGEPEIESSSDNDDEEDDLKKTNIKQDEKELLQKIENMKIE